MTYKKPYKINPETVVQITICNYIRYQFPKVADHIIKIDNEGVRSITGHALAVKAGLCVGAADIFLAWPRGGFNGMFLEVKREGWKITPSQRLHVDRQLAFLKRMENVGFYTRLCIGSDQGIEYVKEYLSGKLFVPSNTES